MKYRRYIISFFVFVIFIIGRIVYTLPMECFALPPISQITDKPQSEDTPQSINMVVEFKDNLLSIDAHAVRLESIIDDVSRKTGTSFILHGSAEITVSAAISNLPVEEAIKSLIRGGSYVFIYEPKDSSVPPSIPITAYIFIGSFGSDSGGAQADHSKEPLETASASLEEERTDDLFDLFDSAQDDKESLLQIVDALRNDSSINRRIAAAQLLGSFDDSYSKSALAEALSDKKKEIRMAAVQALGNIASDEDVEHFLQALDDEDMDIRAAAVEKLVIISDKTALPHLMRASKDVSELVREAASEALDSLGGVSEDVDPDSQGQIIQ